MRGFHFAIEMKGFHFAIHFSALIVIICSSRSHKAAVCNSSKQQNKGVAIECGSSNKGKGLFVHVSGRIKMAYLKRVLNMGTDCMGYVHLGIAPPDTCHLLFFTHPGQRVTGACDEKALSCKGTVNFKVPWVEHQRNLLHTKPHIVTTGWAKETNQGATLELGIIKLAVNIWPPCFVLVWVCSSFSSHYFL